MASHSKMQTRKQPSCWSKTKNYTYTNSNMKIVVAVLVLTLLSISRVSYIGKMASDTMTSITSSISNQQPATSYNSSLQYTKDDLSGICIDVDNLLNNTYDHLDKERSQYWVDFPSSTHLRLTCEQLMRSIPHMNMEEINEDEQSHSHMNMQSSKSLHRLAVSLGSLRESWNGNATATREENSNNIDTKSRKRKSRPLKIVVLGGSMTAGHIDTRRWRGYDMKLMAWPNKLEEMMHHKWGNESVQVINLAKGGANERAQLGMLDLVMEHEPIDIILVELAVNDQCDYKDKEMAAVQVNQTSHELLTLLTHFPNTPAVLAVELFRTDGRNSGDAKMHCPDHVIELTNGTCAVCPQWWWPQDWRDEARHTSSVAAMSYRDAVWPNATKPPDNLCKYWEGKSHPWEGTHIRVASMIMFHFLTVMSKDVVVFTFSEDEGNSSGVHIDINKLAPPNICLGHLSSLRAVEGNPLDPMPSFRNDDNSSCWKYREDSPHKYGWICEETSDTFIKFDDLILKTQVHVGGKRNVLLSRLMSYDERMSVAQAWFSGSINSTSTTSSSQGEAKNVFVGNPVWNITSWHEERSSIPKTQRISLEGLEFSDGSNIHWPNEEGSGKDKDFIVLTLNIRLILGSSKGNQQKEGDKVVDKFKLLGITTC